MADADTLPRAARGARESEAASPAGADAPGRRTLSNEALRFPGSSPLPMRRGEFEAYDGRIEYWDDRSGTAWVVAENSGIHEGSSRRLPHLVERIASVRGAPIVSFGSVSLVVRDAEGRAERALEADETLYLHPDHAATCHRKQRRHALVVAQIVPSARRVGPVGMLQLRLPPQLFADAHRLERSEATDAIGPVRILGVTRPLPVARHERADAVGDHPVIVSPPADGLNPAALESREPTACPGSTDSDSRRALRSTSSRPPASRVPAATPLAVRPLTATGTRRATAPRRPR